MAASDNHQGASRLPCWHTLALPRSRLSLLLHTQHLSLLLRTQRLSRLLCKNTWLLKRVLLPAYTRPPYHPGTCGCHCRPCCSRRGIGMQRMGRGSSSSWRSCRLVSRQGLQLGMLALAG